MGRKENKKCGGEEGASREKSRGRRKKKGLGEEMRILARGVKLWMEICPQVLVYDAVLSVVNRLTPYFPLCMSAFLVNELAGGCDLRRLILLSAVAVLGTFAISIFSHLLRGKREGWIKTARIQMELYLSHQQNRMQYEHMENPEVTLMREEIDALSNSVGAGIMKILFCFPDLAGYLFDLAVSAGVTFSMLRIVTDVEVEGFLAWVNSPWCALAFLLLLLCSLGAASRITASRTQKMGAALEPLAENNMGMMAYEKIRGEDVAGFNLKEMVVKEWERTLLRPGWITEYQKVIVKYGTAEVLQKAFLDLAVFVITAAKAFIGVFGIGNYILYRGTVGRFVNSVSKVVWSVTELRENNKYLEKLYRFLDLPDKMYHGTLAVEKRDDIEYEVEFRDVSFRYPGTEQWVLRHVNLKFRIGDKLAVVGENGSGKTTFIKLLCRLYDPTEGTILLNGIDITRYRYEEYVALFSVVFQDYKLFQFSLGANVAADFDYDREKVEKCLVQAGFGDRLRELDQGVETALGRGYENDGIELSGGEEQKVALARALYKDAPFVVLDEPTAALDPIAEAAVYEDFQRLTENKTAVFISHRLSSCRFCDDIAVFHRGRLVQRGSHSVLMGEEGKYRELWNAQAQYYTEDRKG